MRKRILIVFSFLLTSLAGSAQGYFQRATNEVSVFNYSKAIEILQHEVSKENYRDNFETALLLADCYRLLNDVSNSKIWYAKAIDLQQDVRSAISLTPGVYYHYAQMLRSSGDYDKAKFLFLKYDSLAGGQFQGALYAQFCDSAVSWRSRKAEFEIWNIQSLNTPESEFGLVCFKDGVVFTSDRISGKVQQKTYGWTGNSFLNLYVASPVQHDSFFAVYPAPVLFAEAGSMEWHDGPLTFNSDFTRVFINCTRLKKDKGKSDPGNIKTHLLKIYTAAADNGSWSATTPFFLNSDAYSIGHPALTPDGMRLYFVSDMPGGLGETDIWYCDSVGGKWSEPVNPGPMVNSPGKEMFPFAAAGGELYFASDGRPGFGGLDLYKTKNSLNFWSAPQNMGSPINSSFDDFSLAISDKAAVGYFSSNRPGGKGGDDIYAFRKVQSVYEKPTDSMIRVTSSTTRLVADKPDPCWPDTLKINKSYRLENILYDFDLWNIRADARPSVDKLISLMKEYPILIELGSHTDCRGSEQYNLDLSQKRAESAVGYIISGGISADRITAKGYGKTRLLNNCNCKPGNKCSEEDHQFNRRTEFKITGLNAKQH
ncbi:MAG: OmpA family protein [Bacteroidales bacterium]